MPRFAAVKKKSKKMSQGSSSSSNDKSFDWVKFLGQKHLDRSKGTKTQPVEDLNLVKLVGIYFSAHWYINVAFIAENLVR